MGPCLAEAHTVTKVCSRVLAGSSCTFNIERSGTAGVRGNNILSADQVALIAGNAGTNGTSFATSAIPANFYLYVDIAGVTDTPGQLAISMACTVP